MCPTCNGTKKVKKTIRDICLIDVETPCPDCSATLDKLVEGMSAPVYATGGTEGFTVYVGEGSATYTYEGDCS